MAAGLRQPRSSQGFFLLSSTFQTHFVQLIKLSQVFVRPTGIQTLPSPVNSIIVKKNRIPIPNEAQYMKNLQV